MDLTPEAKESIDNMSYKELLMRVRFSSIGDPLFQGETGSYIMKRLGEIRPPNHAQISKEIGWL